jgi:hypothetical protein
LKRLYELIEDGVAEADSSRIALQPSKRIVIGRRKR